jgi:hypothetical protein
LKEIINKLKIKEKDIDELSLLLIEKFKDGENEANNIVEGLKTLKGVNIYKNIIEIKTNYLSILKSDFSILFKYSFGFNINNSQTNKLKDCSKKSLVFYYLFRTRLALDLAKFKEQICNEAYLYKKNTLLYNSANQIIANINSSTSIEFKLPTIEKFEIETLYVLENRIDKLIKYIKDIEELNTERIESLNINHMKDFKEFTKTIDNLEGYEFDYNNEKIEKDLYKKQLEEQIQYNVKREPLYVIQFDNTIWGDNYPALKVFYKFLFDYYSIDFNWSFFASMMTTESKDVINLNIKTINKGETGYLLFKLKEFFVSSISKDYFNWLSKKITVDGKNINKSFYDGKIWDSSLNLPNQEKINIIIKLHRDIKSRYNKV